MSTTTANLGLFKYNTATDANVAFNINSALNNNWDIIDEALAGGGGSSRNIGEIVASTIPLTDAGLHLLDGSLIQGGGIYSDFVTYIAELRTSYPDLFTTESDWQESISNYGVCGKFVYDSTNNTVRLPKITGIIEGTTDLTALGDLVEAGLPNITGATGQSDCSAYTYNPYNTGAFYTGGESKKYFMGRSGESSNTYGLLHIDASRSSSIYGNSSTVQPQTIKAFYYIVIATSTKTSIQVDIDEIATDLNGKVDKADLAEVQCIVETYVNGTSWYRIWSDGWCEQGGAWGGNVSGWASASVTYLKAYSNTNYQLYIQGNWSDAASSSCKVTARSTTGFTGTYANNLYSTMPSYWQACGYIEV